MLNKKVRRPVILAAAVAAGLLVAGAWLFWPRPQSAPVVAEWTLRPGDPETIANGKTLYTAHCASCHGARLEGQPKWRVRLANGLLPAPPPQRQRPYLAPW